MIYRENGQFKTSYRADQQVFPILQDRVFIGAGAGCRLRRRAAAWPATTCSARILIPFLIFSLAALGREHPGRLLRPDLARLGRLHGGRRLRRLQLLRPRSRHAADPGADPRRPVRHRVRHPVRPAEPARARPVPGGGDAGGAVLRRLDVPAHQVVHARHAVGLGRGVEPAGLRPADRKRASASTCSAWSCWW